jgi:glutamyl-tRNA synthetase
MSTIVTRFAPSPTGYLHIGSARTALFNYLYAKKNNGKFLLRIEDTDRQRSTDAAIGAIIKGLQWLELDWDGDIVYQSRNINRHQEVAEQLLAAGKAYKCFHTKEELIELKEQARADAKPIRSIWRDKQEEEYPDQEYVIRIKVPLTGVTSVLDNVQGAVTFNNDTLEDLVLLRSDGTPTYMLAVVVDDHDMGVTDIIRGDDHLSNTPKQIIIYEAMGWQIPRFAHIPLIHGEDGAKLSKRHGALGVEEYKEMGYLKETINNYLLRLGWSLGDKEIIDRDEAIENFNLSNIGKSPSRLDFKKLDSLNAHYIKEVSEDILIAEIAAHYKALSEESVHSLKLGLPFLRERAKTIPQLVAKAKIFILGGITEIPEEFKDYLQENLAIYSEFSNLLKSKETWERGQLMEDAKNFVGSKNKKLADLAKYYRILLTGEENAPSVFDILVAIGKEETINRITNNEK